MKWIAVLATVPVGAAGAPADYVADRKAAAALVRAGQHKEALAAFTRMADRAATDVQKSDALQQATACARSLNDLDQALRLAKQIPLTPLSKTCQMQVLETGRRWQEIADRFRDEDIDSWPESVRGDAFFARGHAWFILKNGTPAARDLEKAVAYLTDSNARGLCLNVLGDVCSTLLNDTPRAIETYRRVYATSNVYKHCQAALRVAELLRQQRRPEAALQELSRIKMDEVTAPYWRGRMLGATGDALAAAGKKPAAAARYAEALQVKGLPAEVRAECERALQKLKPDPR